jgi:hypothetical protein
MPLPCPPWALLHGQHSTDHLPRRHLAARPDSSQRINSLKRFSPSVSVRAVPTMPTCARLDAQSTQSVQPRSRATAPRTAPLPTRVCTASHWQHIATPAPPSRAPQTPRRAQFSLPRDWIRSISARNSWPPTKPTTPLHLAHNAVPRHRPRHPIASDEHHRRPSATPLNISGWKPLELSLALICPLSTSHPPPGAHRRLAGERKPAETSIPPGRPTPVRRKVAVTPAVFSTLSPSLWSRGNAAALSRSHAHASACREAEVDDAVALDPRAREYNCAHFPPLHARSASTTDFPDLDSATSDPCLTPATLVSSCTTKP